jgi:hypothetical protein
MPPRMEGASASSSDRYNGRMLCTVFDGDCRWVQSVTVFEYFDGCEVCTHKANQHSEID